MRKAIFVGVASMILTLFVLPRDVKSVCADCQLSDQSGPGGLYAKCEFVDDDAYETCTISASDPYNCWEEDPCVYGSPGGGSGGGGSDGGDTCSRSPGEWCPAECASCTEKPWYY